MAKKVDSFLVSIKAVEETLSSVYKDGKLLLQKTYETLEHVKHTKKELEVTAQETKENETKKIQEQNSFMKQFSEVAPSIDFAGDLIKLEGIQTEYTQLIERLKTAKQQDYAEQQSLHYAIKKIVYRFNIFDIVDFVKFAYQNKAY